MTAVMKAPRTARHLPAGAQRSSGSQEESRSSRRAAVRTALAANVAVALAKAAAAALTGSSAMLAEALHSVADSVNEILLLVGARRASRPADLHHQFGHARYRYLYAFVVSLAVFWIGGHSGRRSGPGAVPRGTRPGDASFATRRHLT
jgi:divalent metal cation (Fe/Co/Zn/Cd) transporter